MRRRRWGSWSTRWRERGAESAPRQSTLVTCPDTTGPVIGRTGRHGRPSLLNLNRYVDRGAALALWANTTSPDDERVGAGEASPRLIVPTRAAHFSIARRFSHAERARPGSPDNLGAPVCHGRARRDLYKARRPSCGGVRPRNGGAGLQHEGRRGPCRPASGRLGLRAGRGRCGYNGCRCADKKKPLHFAGPCPDGRVACGLV